MIKLSSYTAYDITYYFKFISKHRKRKLVGNIKKRLEGMIRFCAQVNEFEIIELNIQPDHVHMVITAKPSYSPSEVMQLIKGRTSKKLRNLYPKAVETIWAEGYFVGTIGQRNINEVIKYVHN